MKRTIWRNLWDLFFPRRCLLCRGGLLVGEKEVCVGCLSQLPRTGWHRETDNPMAQLFAARYPIGRAAAFLYYGKGSDTQWLVHRLKYYDRPEAGVSMGRVWAREIASDGFFKGVDVLIPVPLHWRKQLQRGYNQSERLAQGISEVTGIPVEADALVRTRYTESQTRKDHYERQENVHRVFACPQPERWEGKHVMLVDDVLTTGATLSACADALCPIPGIRISMLALSSVRLF